DVQRYAISIVDDLEIRLATRSPADNRDLSGPGVDAVLDELRHGLQGIRLRKRDDVDRIPIVANAEFAGLLTAGISSGRGGHGAVFLPAEEAASAPVQPIWAWRFCAGPYKMGFDQIHFLDGRSPRKWRPMQVPA